MEENLRVLLERVRDGDIDVDKALEEVENLPYKDLGYTKLDTHREIRRGYPEAVFCVGKTDEQIAEILEEFPEGQTAIATKASRETYEFVKERIDEAVYHEEAMVIQVGGESEGERGVLSVVTAGTSDQRIAEECAVSAEIMGNEVERIYDVGISGVHRLFPYLDVFKDSDVVVVVAGMEGALPGFIAGLISVPVIGVPTSVGYGSNFEGLTPLFTMLNSCVPGLAVVNIDNGYGAAYMASLINEKKG